MFRDYEEISVDDTDQTSFPSIPTDVRIYPTKGNKWSVVQDGVQVALCRTEDKARELAFSIVSELTGFRSRVLAA